jgi:acetyl esterase/lipase
LLKNNIIIATVDYRLASDEIHMPIPVIDAKDAIRFLKKHGKKYGINGKRISIWGTSAGGHIAQITGFSSEDQFQGDVALANYTSKVNLIINCFGPVDMNRIFRTDFSAIEAFFAKIFRPNDYDKLLLISRHFSGLDFEDDREELIEFCDEYTSINFITKDSPPVITLQGLADEIVDPEHALILQSALDHYYVPNILKEYEDVEHSFLEASEAQWSDISKSMVDMIYKYN